MPGVNLNLDLPALGDPMATAIAKLVAALEAVEDDLAGKILSSEININAALSMNGNSLTNVGSVQMLAGNPPTAAGSIYYDQGEWYVIDATGPVRITLNGALDITGTGGFVGDYGQPGVLAAASYDNASQEFRFYADGGAGVWADIVCDDLVLEGTNGSVRLGVDPAINTARQVIFKSLPSSGVGLLVYNSSTSTVEDIANTSPTAISVSCPITTTNTVKAADFRFTVAQTLNIPAMAAHAIDTTAAVVVGGFAWEMHGVTPIHYPVALLAGAHISAFKLFMNKHSPGTVTITAEMWKYNSLTGALASLGSVSINSNAPGFTSMTNASINYTLAANEQVYVTASVSGVGYLDQILHLEVSHTRP